MKTELKSTLQDILTLDWLNQKANERETQIPPKSLAEEKMEIDAQREEALSKLDDESRKAIELLRSKGIL